MNSPVLNPWRAALDFFCGKPFPTRCRHPSSRRPAVHSGFRGPLRVDVPSWAKNAEVRVKDRSIRQVAGKAYANIGNYSGDRAVICSAHTSTLDVRGASTLDVVIVVGAAGPDARHGCLSPTVSTPKRGVIAITFR